MVSEDTDAFVGKWYVIGKSGELTQLCYQIEKNGAGSYTFTAVGELGDGEPYSCEISERNDKELVLDIPSNLGPIYICLTDSDHITISGINAVSEGKIVLSGITWDCVRGD